MFTRKDAWSEGGDFSDETLLWYAKGVAILKRRPISDRTSWSFLAAIHGINESLWSQLGYLNDAEVLPSQEDQEAYWNQCQHGSWYFIPWHRGYLHSLETIVRDAIMTEFKDAPKDWALPYWNYSDTKNPNARDLPPAFTSKTMPDGNGGTIDNPLYVKQRYGKEKGTLPLPEDDVSLEALNATVFTGTNAGGHPGFGGPKTGFSHTGRIFGTLENLPHNFVHTHVGNQTGENPDPEDFTTYGLMANGDTAGLDPIFYLHHANIDRLWEVWLQRCGGRENPTDECWLTGPLPPESDFIVPMPNKEEWTFTAQDVESTATLGYHYDHIEDPLEGVSARTVRRKKLRGSPQASLSGSNNSMGNQKRAELIGANSSNITVLGASASTQVQLDQQVMQQTKSSFIAFDASDPSVHEPDRIYLNLENIRCDVDGQILDIYINLPSGADPAQHPELRAGSVALFGVRKASLPNQPHGGMGVTHVVEITDIVDALHLEGELHNLSSLEVSLLSRTHLTPAHNLTVERISVYREGN